MAFSLSRAIDTLGMAAHTPPPRYQDSQLAQLIIGGERYRELTRRQSYYDCTQHDHKTYDFDGRPISPGGVKNNVMISGLDKLPGIAPLSMRRPSAPYRLGKAIISEFTNLVFGEDRFPEIHVPGDVERQYWTKAIAKATSLPARMIQARNYGGSCGSAGLSWAVINGHPRVRVHNTRCIRVVEWEDRDALIPLVVEEVKLFYRDEPDPEAQNRVRRVWYWWRRTWNPDQDIVYKEIRAKQNEAPQWHIDPDKTDNHGDGACRFTWIQNKPSEEEDGVSDLDGVWEQCDAIDLLYSVIMKGGIKNLDPTLKLQMDAAQIKVMGLKKGSDAAIITGKDGDASYMELAGTSITAGLELFKSMRDSTLETAQCVLPDPDTMASQGVSSVSIKALYSRMLANGGILREQYGTGAKRVLDQINEFSATKISTPVIAQLEDGTERPAQFEIKLPPRPEEEPEIDELGQPTGANLVKLVPLSPGEAGEVDFAWPPWFTPTPDDQAKLGTTLQAATGGKAFVSKETATKTFARAIGVDPDAEWEKNQAQQNVEAAAQADMFAQAGGPPDPNDPNAPPDPESPEGEDAAGGSPGKPPFGGGPPKIPPPAAKPPAGNPIGRPNPFARRR